MNYGSIEKNTAAGRLYKFLKNNLGVWYDGWTLTIGTKTTAVSTRISEIRKQLESRGNGEQVEHKEREGRHYYRLVWAPPLHSPASTVSEAIKEVNRAQ